jgi:serine phosphatase RsbU (regulator of sigma subunit)
MLAGQAPGRALSAVQLVLQHEQQDDAMFATVCMISVAPGRRSAVLRLAGHPAPLLVTPRGIAELVAPTCPPLGFNASGEWPGRDVALGEHWSLLLYTDGLIEGRISRGPYRLGTEGLIGLLRVALGAAPLDPGQAADDALLGRLIDQVRDLNSGDLNDDLAILALGYA